MASNHSSNGLLPFPKPDNDHHADMEAGKQGLEDSDTELDIDDAVSTDPFDIANTKNAPRETLRRWRVNH